MRKLIFALLGAAAACMPGCMKENTGAMQVKVVPVNTRVTGVHFDRDDRIGLTIVKNSVSFADNVAMIYDGSVFTAPGLVWYAPRNETSTLTAYYPYSEQGWPAEFSIAADQTSGCASSDLLAAVKTDVMPASSAVGMLFHHLLSQVTIVVSNTSQNSIESVVLSGFVPTAEVNYIALKAVAKSGVAVADIEAFEVTPDAAYRVVLVPQQGALTLTVRTDDGRSLSKTLAAALLEGGMQYDMSMSVTDHDIDVTLSGDIQDWTDGGSLDVPDSGDDATLSYQGVEYRTQWIGGKHWMAENMCYVPEETVLWNGVWYPSRDAEACMEAAYIRDHGMLYDYVTVSAGASAKAGGAWVRGICPPGWHIPTKAELELLISSEYDYKTFFALAGLWNKKLNSYGDETRGYLVSDALSGDGSQLTCLRLSRSNPPTAAELSVENGLSLRCVQDDK